MIELSKLIFGKKYRFRADPGFEELLKESVKPYCDYEGEASDINVFISDHDYGQDRLISSNPKIYARYEHSFTTDFESVKIRWGMLEDKQLTAHLSFPEIFLRTPILRAWYSKFRSMEYSTKLETFEQILHELFLIPSTYFFSDLVPVHAAAISFNGKGVLLAGTGGTGKTSALLSLRNKSGISFLSDDVAVLASNNYIYPNFAWPKIYGYNLIDTADLRSQVLSDRGVLDKLHFDLRAKINPTRVRRKIQAGDLYRDVAKEGAKIAAVFYLFRQNVPSLSVDELNVNQAVEMSIAVMETEYAIFHKFLYWDQFNVLADKHIYMSSLNFDDVKENWRSSLRSNFNDISLKLVRIPIDTRHGTYLEDIQREICIQMDSL